MYVLKNKGGGHVRVENRIMKQKKSKPFVCSFSFIVVVRKLPNTFIKLGTVARFVGLLLISIRQVLFARVGFGIVVSTIRAASILSFLIF